MSIVETNRAVAKALSERVSEWEIGGGKLLVLPTEVRDVVTFRGSFEPGPDLATTDDLVQSLAADLLDKGTTNRGRLEIAEELEGRGAQLSFYSDALRVGFAGRALKEDFTDVMAILNEQLRKPLFDEAEFEKSRTRAIASVRRSMDSTSAQAGGALKRALYTPSHPNFVPTPEQELGELEALTRDEVVAYHQQHFGVNGLNMVVVGDVEANEVSEIVQSNFADWAPSEAIAKMDSQALESTETGERIVSEMADKFNLDVQFGHGLSLRRDSDEFLPLYVGVFILGGNFSSRLMQTVRDEMGLTYGIRSTLAGLTVEHAGHWKVSVSLSQENLETGIDATREVIRQFVEGGISPSELETVKMTLSGSHVVGMATTGGIASRLLVNAERGFPVSYLDDYPALINAITVDDVNHAVQRHLNPSALVVSVAGTMPA